ncbi:retrovirus-related pol polyprotein from transposon TNT 1-94 [Tanacetum coccineum]
MIYSKENYLATFTPHKQLTPEQIFLSNDLIKMKAEALKEQTTTSRPIKALMVYPPNTPTTLVPEHDEIERKNLLIENDNLIAECLSKEVFYIATNSKLTVLRFTEMHNAHTTVQARCLELEAELAKLLDKVQKDDHTELVKHFSNLQKQYRLFRQRMNKVKQEYKDCYDSIKITRAKHIEQTTALVTKNENLKVQIKNKMKCITLNSVKPRVLAPGTYAIDVEPIPPHNRNNREVHLDYLKHLKESVKTLREIVEEAKVEKPLDRSLASACLYTKHSQELLEYVIGTFPKDFNKQDKKHASTPLTRKKQVTFEDQFKKVWKPKQVKKVWKASGKVLTSVGYQWRPTGRIFILGEQCPLTRLTKPKVVPAKQTENYQAVPVSLPISLENQAIVDSMQSAIASANQQEPNQNWGSNFINSPSSSVFKCRNFVKKFIRKVRFGNDHFGAIMGYGDYVIGDSVISRVYYVERLGYNLFSVEQFCNSDLKVAFRKHSCYVRDTDGVELIKGSRGSNLYTISVEDMIKSSPICLLSKASKNKSWLWHRRLNHLNFGTINDLARKDLVKFFRLKDETQEFIIKFLKQIQVGLNKTVRYICTDNGKEFFNQVLTQYYESVGIFHQKSVPRTPQQNGVVERRNHTLVEAARTMLIFSKALMFLWAEVVATACYTQNRSLIHTIHNKTPYEPSEDLEKLQPTADIGIFVGYAPSRKGYRIYNKRTRRIMETIHVQFNELYKPMAPVQLSTGPAPMFLMPGQIKPPRVKRPVSPALAVSVPVNSTGTPSSTTIDQDAHSPSHSPSSSALQSPSL